MLYYLAGLHITGASLMPHIASGLSSEKLIDVREFDATQVLRLGGH